MADKIFLYLNSLPKEWVVFITAALPVVELRGSIPFGILSGMPVVKAYILSVLGNMIPVPFLLLLLTPVSEYLRRFPLWKRFFEWLFERTKKKASLVEKYEALGLILFVCIPLPVTGAWTGSIAATLFKIRFRYALSAIAVGVIIAGIIVTAICLLGKGMLV